MRTTITFFPDGRAILSVDGDLTEDMVKLLHQQFESWKATPDAIAIISNCSVEHAESIEIDLPEEAA